MKAELALFPLHTVLFPGGRLELRIFEARYLDLVARCLREEGRFGVCLIVAGSEVGVPAQCAPVGTAARIADWGRLPDGLLGITVIGEQRFRVLHAAARADGLLTAEVEWLAEEETAEPVPDWLPGLLRQPALAGAIKLQQPADAMLAFRIAERLELPAGLRQRLLETEGALPRLDTIRDMLRSTAAAGAGEPA